MFFSRETRRAFGDEVEESVCVCVCVGGGGGG